MTLDQLLTLKTIAEVGSLKAASEVLHKTQPALSQSIKQLESSLNIKLFSREKYRLVLTESGQKVCQQASKLLTEANQLKQLAGHLAQGHEASITIAIEASYDLSLIIPILEQTQNTFPQTQIIIRQEYLSGAREAVQHSKADIAITPIEPTMIASSNFECYWLEDGQLINVAAPKLINRHQSLISVEQLRNEYQIVVQDSGKSSEGKTFSVQSGQRCWYVNDFTAKKTLIESGMGWGRLPEQLVRSELISGSLNKLVLDDLTTELVLSYHAIKCKNSIMGPVATTFWQLLHSHYQK